jgi:hypothetical protein
VECWAGSSYYISSSHWQTIKMINVCIASAAASKFLQDVLSLNSHTKLKCFDDESECIFIFSSLHVSCIQSYVLGLIRAIHSNEEILG